MKTKLSTVQIGIIITALITAFIHAIYLNITMGGVDPLFTLNGLGYLALLIAYFLPAFKKFHGLVRWAFIGYTILTIFAWLAIGDRGWVGWATKVDEIALIVLLFIDKPK